MFMTGGVAAAAEHTVVLNELMLTTPEDQPIPVILFLDQRLTMDDVYPVAKSLPMDARRKYVVETLKARFQDVGSRVMARLESARKSGQVTLLRPLWILNGVRVTATADILRELDTSFPEVVYMTADTRFENTLDAVGWGVADMQMIRVWTQYQAWGLGVIVGHKDSGEDISHPGFAGHHWINPGEDLNHNGTIDAGEINGVDDDHNGYIDDFRGWNFDDDNSNVNDRDGHGTKTGSVISANFTPCDTISVAPGAKLMVLSAYELQGSVWEASQYAVEMGAQVISASLSFKHSECTADGTRECPNYVAHRIVSEMELAAGLLHANSTGNYGHVNPVPFSAAAPSNCPPPAMTPQQPQHGGVSSIVAVAAYNQGGSHEYYSGHGPCAWSRQDICVHARMAFCGPEGSGNEYPAEYEDYPFHNREMPGLIRPDVAGPQGVPSLGMGGGCSSITGTSGATPHVGGACAVIFSRFPGITPEAAYLLLVNGAQDAGAAGLDTLWGYGKIRPFAACSLGVAGMGRVTGLIRHGDTTLSGVRVFTDSSHSIYTAGDGRYTLYLQPGTHWIHCRKYGFGEGVINIAVSAGQELIHDFQLTAVSLADFQGYVTGNGQPLAGIRVWIPEYDLETVSGLDGSFSMPLYHGRYEVHAGDLPWDEYIHNFLHAEAPTVHEFALTLSPRAWPTGPDGYGYRIFDNYDTPWPIYDWIGINPNAGGLPGTELNTGGDGSVQRTLPFTFRFYGADYTTIRIHANGFIMMGSGNSDEWSPYPIPSTSGPNGFLAPFYDDWEPQHFDGGVFYYNDTQNHSVIVEWYAVNCWDTTCSATFQAILYDPLYVPSLTGDGVIKYQYHTINGRLEGLVGLENPSGTDGLQYLFLLQYDPHAVPIEAGRALMITTDPDLEAGSSQPSAFPNEFVLEPNYPNPFNPATMFTWHVPRGARVKLSLFDILGREAGTVFEGWCNAGKYERIYNASGLASGIYFARLETAGHSVAVRKVALVR